MQTERLSFLTKKENRIKAEMVSGKTIKDHDATPGLKGRNRRNSWRLRPGA